MGLDVNAVWRELQKRPFLKTSGERRCKEATAAEQRALTNVAERTDSTIVGQDAMTAVDVEEVLRNLSEKRLDSRRFGLRQLKDLAKQDYFWSVCGSGEKLERLGHLLLLVFGDGPESCSLVAGDFLKRLFAAEVGRGVKGLMQTSISVIERRLNSTVCRRRRTCRRDVCLQERLAASDEVRLLSVELLQVVISVLRDDVAAQMEELYATLSTCCADAFAAVSSAACRVIRSICEIFGRRLFRVAKDFVASVAPLALHRQRILRVEAVQTLQLLIPCGAHEMILELVAFHHPNILSIKVRRSFFLCPTLGLQELYDYVPKRNFFGSLARDSAPKVRCAFVEMVGGWLLCLDERLDYLSRLLPYLLNALTDPVSQIVQRGLEILDSLGGLYEKDHAAEILEKIRYLPPAAQSCGWGDHQEFWKRHEGREVAPFTTRPRLGVRLVVQANFGYFVNGLCNGLSSQDDEITASSLELLRICLLLIEDTVTHHVRAIVDALVKVLATRALHCLDKERPLHEIVRRVARLVGEFAAPDVLSTALEDHRVEDTPHRADAAELLRQLITPVGAAQEEGSSLFQRATDRSHSRLPSTGRRLH